MDEIAWPDLKEAEADGAAATLDLRKALFQGKIDAAKATYQATLDAEKAEDAAAAEWGKADTDAYYAKLQLVYAAYIDTAKASIERVQSRAIYINTAATAISALYTGLLGFRFVKDVNDKVAATMPVRGITPVIFFGLAIALATFYLSFISARTDKTRVKTAGIYADDLEYEMNGYLSWVKQIVEPRLSFLRGAVISLAWGVVTLPVAFISFGRWWPGIAVAFALALITIYFTIAPDGDIQKAFKAS